MGLVLVVVFELSRLETQRGYGTNCVLRGQVVKDIPKQHSFLFAIAVAGKGTVLLQNIDGQYCFI